jgi:Na+-translocating ferredoxin:NAD+ oxidoreductase RNF subunit RnfB
MDSILLSSIISLCVIGLVAASVLFLAAKKFKVFEDPKIDEVEGCLPGANCGGCGFAGCRNFAEAVVKAGSLEELNCPVAGPEGMVMVGQVIGVEVSAGEPMIAVLRCSGSKVHAVPKLNYDGAKNCRIAHSLFSGESGCPSGCLGLGDCVAVCKFDALKLDNETGLPVVDEEKCVACGACVKICPRSIYELRPKGKSNKRVYVACMNTQKGGIAKENCKVACIGCRKCVKATESTSVNVKNFLSYIDTDVDVHEHGPHLIGSCPTGAIVGVGVDGIKPVPKVKKKPAEKPETSENNS